MIVKCMVSEDYLSEPMVIHGKSSTEGTSLYIPEFKGPGKREHFVADTLLPMMVLGLRELGNICVGINLSATMCPRLPGP